MVTTASPSVSFCALCSSPVIPDVHLSELFFTAFVVKLIMISQDGVGMSLDGCSSSHERSHRAQIDPEIDTSSRILIMLSKDECEDPIDDLTRNFCGAVVSDLSQMPREFTGQTVYLCGNISKASEVDLTTAQRVFVIRELSTSYDTADWPVLGLGQLPILVHGVGVFYRRYFDFDLDLFNRISAEHVFQSLTESNKPGTAYRTGIYLTPVEQDGDNLHFRLLRCSSNLSGPTGNFRATDTRIVNALNQEASLIFHNQQAPMNHVLAQIYHNYPASHQQKEAKAKIKAHSDKTKDMPSNGIMAFCTFYDKLNHLQPMDADRFDFGYKGRKSGLTKLHFRLKQCVVDQPSCNYTREFSVTLYPNSVFMMPLSTNRLYTHEIRPAGLDAKLLPVRMGYVVRCSATSAVYKGGQTFLKVNDQLIPLEPSTPQGIERLRELYAQENATDDVVNYGNMFLFSMNNGDYLPPLLAESFQWYDVAKPCSDSYSYDWLDNPFETLQASICFDDVTNGRKGQILVAQQEGGRGVPIMRTTTSYITPAQYFQPEHATLAKLIHKIASLPAGIMFNNAMIEVYSNAYTTMGFHSDQALDLQEGSFIALFSCYKHPTQTTPLRKLVVKSKESGSREFEVPLVHNSVVVFSLDTNTHYRHKIVLDIAGSPNCPENEWMGITFRTSKTFLQFQDGQAHFEDGTVLSMAQEEQRRDLFHLRRRENEEVGFIYPPVTYTLSESDLKLPV